jgi:hypothetical protein
MRHLKSLRRFFAEALFVLALLTLVFPAPIRVAASADARASAADKDENKDERGEPPDPCEQLLKAKGNANGLHGRCETVGIGGGAAKGDFNGDGFADLAVGVPYEDRNFVGQVGAVNIIYGSANGLTATANQFLDETTFGYPYHNDDHFGWALAAGDFNGDGFSDLAIGMPDSDSSITPNDGTVFLIDGSANGLDTFTHRTLFSLNGKGGRAGSALVWADFNGDGFGDLAVGIPNATVISDGPLCSPVTFAVQNAGEVQVFYGSAQSLRQFGAQIFRQGVCDYTADGIGIGDSPEEGDHFGASLAAVGFNFGTLNTTGAGLAIGVPLEDLGLFDKLDAGMVQLLQGGSTGLHKPAGSIRGQILTQDTPGVGGAAETGDQFGRVLATGDFNGDGQDDLAVGVPFEDLSDNTKADAGAVQVFFYGGGADDVVATSGSMFISQANLAGVSVEAGDRMGWALAAGDFDSDGRDDLAIGVPGEDLGAVADAGLVTVLYGSSSGPSLTRIQNWTQDSPGVPDVAEPGDQFGYALSAWNYGHGRESDLAIGVPFEDIVSASTGTLQVDAGAVNVIYGNLSGLNATARPAQFWHQDSPGISDAAQTGDRFGSALY